MYLKEVGFFGDVQKVSGRRYKTWINQPHPLTQEQEPRFGCLLLCFVNYVMLFGAYHARKK